MELIKQIKQAESQAKTLVEDAGKNAVIAGETLKKEQADQLEQAKKHRLDVIENARNQGKQTGSQQANELMTAAAKEQQQLKNTADKRRDSASEKIVSFLQNRLVEQKQS